MTTDRAPRPDGPVMLSGTALVLGVIALVAEVLVFIGLALLARDLAGGGLRGTLVMAGVVLVGILAWGWFMAPTSTRRLPVIPRVGICILLGVVVGGVLLLRGWTPWGWIVLAAGLALALAQWAMDRRVRAAHQARTDCFPPAPAGDGDD